MTVGRRGRPPGRVQEWSSLETEPRIGWLLRSWRLHRRPDGNARMFATELIQAGLAADVSRVSRWETGQAVAPLDVITAYESSLGLSSGTVISIAVALRRTAPKPGVLGTKFTTARLQVALDTLWDSSPTGADWLSFALLTAAKPDLVTLPASVWRSLFARLVPELAVSVGQAYLSRAEALNLLAGHPVAGVQLAQQALEYVEHPNDTVVAARGTALLQRYGARAAGSTAGLHDTVRALPEPSRARLLAAAAERGGATPESTQPVSWARRVLGGSAEDDPLLDRLVAEALFHSSYSTRFYAGFALALAPTRAAVAAGAADLVDAAPPFVAQRFAELLCFVATEAERPALHRLVSKGGPAGLAALHATAHLAPAGPRGDQPDVTALLHGPDDALATSTLHAAGLMGHPALTEAASNGGLADERRFLAGFWQAAGRAISEN